MKAIIISLLSIFSLPGFAQNLIPNPGFERTVPENQVVHWHQPPTTNYHHKKAGEHGAPYSGEYMSGICISNTYYSECMFVILKDSLRKGVEYKLTFFARQQPGTEDCFNFNACNEIQAYFPGKSPPTLPPSLYRVDDRKLIRVPLPDTLINGRLEWKQYGANYTAEGGEQILAFSYFMRKDTAKPLYLPAHEITRGMKLPSNVKIINKQGDNPIMQYYGSGDQAFRVRYYFDEVSLTRMGDLPEKQETTELPVQLEAGQKFTLRNIHFEFDKTDLQPSAHAILDTLATLLKDKPGLKVRIIAHTDNMGTVKYNLELSRGRARSVANYLVQKGLSSSRFTTVGKGESEPIATNETDKGRALNRRVEFEITE